MSNKFSLFDEGHFDGFFNEPSRFRDEPWTMDRNEYERGFAQGVLDAAKALSKSGMPQTNEIDYRERPQSIEVRECIQALRTKLIRLVANKRELERDIEAIERDILKASRRA